MHLFAERKVRLGIFISLKSVTSQVQIGLSLLESIKGAKGHPFGVDSVWMSELGDAAKRRDASVPCEWDRTIY